MSSSDSPSKRERQKQRREAKLAQQRVAEARARRNRMLVLGALGLALLGLIGWFILQQVREGQRAQEIALRAQQAQEAAGCTPDQKVPDAGQGHLAGNDLGSQPPEVLYADRPATSGQHFGNWLKTGVYDQVIDERALVHNLEHGYIVAYYDDDAPKEQVDQLKEFAQSQIDGDFKKLIVAKWDGETFDGDVNFAYTAWNQRQRCEQFNQDILLTFIQAHHSTRGEAPENTLPAHLREGGGTIDPKGEPFLLPPLGQDEASSPGRSDDGALPSEGAS